MPRCWTFLDSPRWRRIAADDGDQHLLSSRRRVDAPGSLALQQTGKWSPRDHLEAAGRVRPPPLLRQGRRARAHCADREDGSRGRGRRSPPLIVVAMVVRRLALVDRGPQSLGLRCLPGSGERTAVSRLAAGLWRSRATGSSSCCNPATQGSGIRGRPGAIDGGESGVSARHGRAAEGPRRETERDGNARNRASPFESALWHQR